MKLGHKIVMIFFGCQLSRIVETNQQGDLNYPVGFIERQNRLPF